VQAAKQSYHHGNLRAALIETTSELLDSRDPDSLSLREVARLAGVSPAAPYRHFADKAALLAAVAEQGFDELVRRMKAAAKAEEDALGRLLALGLSFPEMARERPGHYREMFGGHGATLSTHPALELASREPLDLLREGIVAGQSEGVVRDGDPQTLALTLFATAHGLASLFASGHLKDVQSPEESIGSVLGTLFLGIGPSKRSRRLFG
jgi:AcrR family transcriptional regulator